MTTPHGSGSPPTPRADLPTSPPEVTLHRVETAAQRAAARELVGEYLHWVAEVARTEHGLSFDVDAMGRSDQDDASIPTKVRWLLVHCDDAYVGVGALKRLPHDVGEIQRMYVQPRLRGVGAGRRLVERLLDEARDMGLRTLRLESLKALTAAHALYRSIGFVDIDPYADNSMRRHQAPDALSAYRASAVFMELTLRR